MGLDFLISASISSFFTDLFKLFILLQFYFDESYAIRISSISIKFPIWFVSTYWRFYLELHFSLLFFSFLLHWIPSLYLELILRHSTVCLHSLWSSLYPFLIFEHIITLLNHLSDDLSKSISIILHLPELARFAKKNVVLFYLCWSWIWIWNCLRRVRLLADFLKKKLFWLFFIFW